MIELEKKVQIAILLVIVAVVYAGTLWNGFVFDDNAQVLANPWITDASYLGKIFTSPSWAFDEARKGTDYYRPLLHLSYMIEYHIFGLAPWGFHLVNLILHAVSSLLVFLLAGCLLGLRGVGGTEEKQSGGLGNTPLFVALLFALHPINTEAVAWVACVTELLFAISAMLCLYLYMRGLGKGVARPAMPMYVLSLFVYFAAMLSKETAILVPLLLVAFDWARHRSIGALPFKNYIPYAGVAVLYLIIRSNAMEGAVPPKFYVEDLSSQLLAIFPALISYFKKLVLPIGLSPFYVFDRASAASGASLYLSFAVVGVLGLVLWRVVRRQREAIVFAAFILLPLVPTFYLLFNDPLLDHISIPSDRYLYLPSVGFALFVGLGIKHFLRGRSAEKAAVLGVVLLVVFSGATIKRSFAWQSDFSLWSRAIKTDPDNYFARYVMAELYMGERRPYKALPEAARVVELRPGQAAAHFRLALLYYQTGDLRNAERQFLEVLKIDPTSFDAHYNLGIIYVGKKDWPGAIATLEGALVFCISVDERIKILNALGAAHLGAGDRASARERLEEALKLDPADETTLGSLRYLETNSE